ncbi:MAG: class I SAM-dependent methyltransferase [Candidatus Eisenbacteria bacterium]|jgi:2-polyprenyl-3-methyl-5-hydroxy-6-metoxy-1,4-benzoquinol methylase|nr:class I SAM-dependent methyltransferase [Candidatus Eisenbacteria bacterium]
MNSASSSTACVVCGSLQTAVFAQVRGVPVHTTLLWRTRAEAQGAPVGDVDLTYCRECGHIFNPLFEESKTEYTQAYENSLHFSPLFQKYAESLSGRLISRYGLHGKDVLEIGAGKGDFLAMMVRGGVRRGIGFDPSYVPEAAHRDLVDSGRMAVVQRFYDPETAGATADLYVCRQVLEHIDRPRGFLERVRAGMPEGRGAVVFFEVPNTLCMLRDLDVWTIIYEHCGFFTPQSLGRLFEVSGFDVLSLDEHFEGIFLGIEARAGEGVGRGGNGEAVPGGLASLVEKFERRFEEKVLYWKTTLRALSQAGKRVVIWGGGARGVTFLNMVDTERVISYAVDMNPRKSGAYISGTGQQLIPPSGLISYKPDVVILMNPIYREEVAGTLRELGVHPELVSA